MGLRWVVPCVLAGCYQPTFPAGAACTVDSDCPGGQPCVDNVCGADRPPIDSPGEPDAPLVVVDAPPDGPPPDPVTYVIGDTTDELVDTELIIGEVDPIGAQDHNSVDDDDHALFRFDLSQIPASGTVLNAQLIVRTFDQASEDGGTVLVHRMREAWAEDKATFTNRLDGTTWTGGPGAAPPSRDSASIASFAPNAINTDFQITLPIAMVQEWVATPAVNFGIIIVRGTSEQHVHLRTRENAPNARMIVVVQP
jgi:hypothetical protein